MVGVGGESVVECGGVWWWECGGSVVECGGSSGEWWSDVAYRKMVGVVGRWGVVGNG